MTKILTEKIITALKQVSEPDTGQNVVKAGMIAHVNVSANGQATIVVQVDPAHGARLEPLRQEIERTAATIKGIKAATAVLTAEKPAEPKAPASSDPHGMNKNPRLNLPVKHIIAVASGKGGVGKSTIATNIAVSLARQGHSTGLLDADIYGPSQPVMMGLTGEKPKLIDKKLEPLTAHGVKVMSIGFMLDNDDALIWRGPMVQTAIYQMLRDVRWADQNNPLDVLIVDMPPGTGDAQLTMAQKVPLAGAVIVSTPQDIALIDARKAIKMFEKTNVPIMGLIENMSYYTCTACGHEEHIFGHGEAEKTARRSGHTFLGAIPLRRDIRSQSDAGKPIAADKTNLDVVERFEQIAQEIMDHLEANL